MIESNEFTDVELVWHQFGPQAVWGSLLAEDHLPHLLRQHTVAAEAWADAADNTLARWENEGWIV